MDRVWAMVVALFATSTGPVVDHEALRAQTAAALAYASLLQEEPAPLPAPPTPTGTPAAQPSKSAPPSVRTPAPVKSPALKPGYRWVTRRVCINGVCSEQLVQVPIQQWNYSGGFGRRFSR